MSKKLINGKILAIQLGRNETQIALVGKNAEILHGITVATPLSAVEDGMIYNQEGVTEMLKEALKTPEFKGVRQVVFTLCTSQVIMETATVPEMPKAKLEKLIQANADMYFPVDIKDYRLIWEIIGSKKNEAGTKEVTVQLWAVPNEMLRRYYQAANACGLSVAAIDYCGHSAATAVGASFSRPAKPPKAKAAKVKDPEIPKEPKQKKKIDWNAEITFGKKKKKVEPDVPTEAQAGPRPVSATDLHILMDAELLGLTFVQEGQVVYQRFYRCGADPSYQFSELAMMVEYFQTQDIGRGSEITGYVSGPGSADTDMVEMLSGMLGMVLTPFRTGQDPRWLLCIGASQTNLEFGNPSFNTTVRVRRTINTDLWQYAAILASGAALVAMVLMLLNARLDWNSEISSLENEYTILSGQAAKVNGFKENYESYQTAYDAYDRDWDALFDSLHTYNDNLVFVLKELESVMPENTSVTDIIIDSDSVMISFACDDKEEAAYLIMSLRDMEYVDVNTISNLIGGGKGAATEYGTPIEEVAPPTEGGSDEEPQQEPALTDTEGENYGTATVAETNTKQNYMAALKTLEESDYAKIPDTKLDHRNFDAVKANHSDLTFGQRSAAFRELLGTNPFAANHFVDLLKQDYTNDTYHVANYLLRHERAAELMPLMTLFMNGNADWESIQQALAVVLDILTENGDILGKTEAMLCSDSYMDTSYVHYLEVQLSVRQAQTHPYLNPETVAPNGATIQIDTENDALDEWVNAELDKYQIPELESIACSGCHEHSDANSDNTCDSCQGIVDENACTHLQRDRYINIPGTEKHTYICGECGVTIEEDCADSDGNCSCDLCRAEKHNIALKQIEGTRTHAQKCINENCDKAENIEACTDSDGNELCDVCGGSVAFTRAEIEILERTHGQVPQPTGDVPSDYEAYKEYKVDKHPTYFEREAAIVNLFAENAFAANDYFEDIVKLFGYEDKITVTDEFKSIQSVLDKVGQLLEINGVDDNEKKLKQIEELIFAYDPSSDKYDVKTAYLYYLEKAMSGKKEEDPHLSKKEDGNIGGEDQERVLETWEYVKKQNEMISSRADYEDILYNYLMSSSDKKTIKNKIGSEMVDDLDKYFNFESGDPVWKDKYEAAFQLSAEDSNLRKLLKIGFLLNYYDDPYREYDVLDELVTDYRGGKTAYATELLLILQLSEREAGIDKDKNQDTTLEEHEKEIEELKKQLEALKGDAEGEEQGGGASSGAVAGDTRVFLDIGLLYTDELWNQELQRKGLNRDAKLPKLELEVG